MLDYLKTAIAVITLTWPAFAAAAVAGIAVLWARRHDEFLKDPETLIAYVAIFAVALLISRGIDRIIRRVKASRRRDRIARRREIIARERADKEATDERTRNESNRKPHGAA